MLKPKVIVIGLDGATWNLIRPWAEKGKLSTFGYLMENGAWGILKSTVPPLSPSAWVSIYTGCKPSKHGIFGFVKRKSDSYFYRPISSRDVNKKPIWDILSECGLRCVVINALFVYPPKPVNGILITGLGTPSKDSDFVYPRSYKDIITKKFPKYDVDFNEDLLLVSDDAKSFIRKVEDVTKEQIELTKFFIKNESWDFLFSIFRALDVIQHYFWNDIKLIYNFYRIFDEFIGEILHDYLKDEKFVLFIVSDHGFSKVKKYFCINNWLEQIGMLRMIEKQKKDRSTLITAETVKKILLKLRMRKLVWKLKRTKLLERFLKIIPSEEFKYIYQIKWDETNAYYYEGSDGIININLKGRDPCGIVEKKDYNDVVAYICNELKKLEDPETGEKIVERVYTKEELYGSSDNELPDIFILMKEGYRAVAYNKLDSSSVFMPPVHGRILRPADHHINGIFLAFGWNVTRGKKVENAVKLWDIAPTIMNVLSVPAAPYMDGRVLTDIFCCNALQVDANYASSLEKEVIRRKIEKLRKKL